MRWYLPIHILLALSFLSHLVSRATICADASIVDQKMVRKRQGEERTASSLSNTMLQKKMTGNEFGRIILEEEMPYYYSFSYSYSFSYYPCSFSYPPMSYSLSFLPTQVMTLEPNSDETAAPSERATVVPSYSPTFWPSEQPSSSITSSVTNTPTPFDVNSNDPGEPVTVSSSPSAAAVTSAPSISPTIDQTQIITEVNSNSTSTTSGIINQEEEQDTSDDSKTFLIPVVGLAAGAFIVGIAVKAIDRRHRPDAYQNLDEDSQSSFSLP